MQLNRREIHRAQLYQCVDPIQLGNLHQRMKLVMKVLANERDAVSNDLWQAIHDLEMEVKYTEPAKPPYSRRTANLESYGI